MTLFLLHYCKYHNIEVTNNNLCHYCDNSTVIGRMQWFQERDINTPNSHLSPDNDVQSQIEATMHKLQITFPSQWVKGHQEPKDGEELTWEAKLNIEADALATEARNETSNDSIIFHQYPRSKIMLYINGTPITRNLAKEIRNAWTTQDLREFMTEHFGWETTTGDTIDWYSHGSSLTSLTYYQHVFSVKLIHERLPVQGEIFSASPNKICPCCKQQEETSTHFLKCHKNPHKSTEISDGLKPIFDKNDVDPTLRLLIHRALANHPITIDILEGMNQITDFEPYYKLIAEQEEIGWHQLHLGQSGLSWDRCQRRFLENKYENNLW
jgi:hypothetical protein